MDEIEKVCLTSMKIGVAKVPKVSFRTGSEDALLEVRDFMKTVHVELANKGRKVLVLEPFA